MDCIPIIKSLQKFKCRTQPAFSIVKSMRRFHHSSAFSLVELSIVLVILGLLVGGILAGQSLIRAAELRAVTTERDRYLAAIGAFRDKYFAFPGDFSTSAFGTTGWIGFGNGDRQITQSLTPTANEESLFWIHLTQAGLIEGSYTNIDWSSAHTIGTHVPRSKVNGAGWFMPTTGTKDESWFSHYPAEYGNALYFGKGNAWVPAAAITAPEAWNIDTKIDDGKPDKGNVMTMEAQADATNGCTNPGQSASIQTNVAYDLDNPAIACVFLMKTGY